MKHTPLLPAPTKLLASEKGFPFDVAVPFDPSRYDAKTIMSMVRLVNRRGRVRWFVVSENDDGIDEWKWELPDEPIKGVDYLPDVLSDLLDGKHRDLIDHEGDLVISFEDRTDARAFARDLALIKSVKTRKRRRKAQPVIEQPVVSTVSDEEINRIFAEAIAKIEKEDRLNQRKARPTW